MEQFPIDSIDLGRIIRFFVNPKQEKYQKYKIIIDLYIKEALEIKDSKKPQEWLKNNLLKFLEYRNLLFHNYLIEDQKKIQKMQKFFESQNFNDIFNIFNFFENKNFSKPSRLGLSRIIKNYFIK